jgi:hypothetical protein
MDTHLAPATNTRLVRADEIQVGNVVWSNREECLVIRVRDAADGHLVLTLRPGMDRTRDVRISPLAMVQLVED